VTYKQNNDQVMRVPGEFTFEVRAIDAAGNVDPTPASHTFTVDFTGPGVSLDSGPEGTVATSSVTFEFSSPNPGEVDHYSCTLVPTMPSGPRTEDNNCMSPKAYNGLQDGEYLFIVTAFDAASNSGEAHRSFTVDTTP
jgi:hypothetical protein